MISVADIERLIANPYPYNIIRLLREGPIKVNSLKEILFSKFKLDNEKEFENGIKELLNYKFITEVILNFNELYLLLIRDFYVIRVPAKKVIEYIQRAKNFPKALIKSFLTEVQKYFSHYMKSKEMFNPQFEQKLVSLILDPEIEEVLRVLRVKPVLLKILLKKFPQFKKHIDELVKLNIIKSYSDPSNKRDLWIILKSDLNFELFYPEYMIKQINEKLAKEEISKELSLKALSRLKMSYLETEDPDRFKLLKQKIDAKLEEVNTSREPEIKSKEKIKALIKLYEQIGDYDNKNFWKEKLSKLEKID
ncbi:MAG: hypothetical protein ACTSR8_13655 [Promethearchaeota archaeon]